MIKRIKKLFRGKNPHRISDYSGLSDFLIHAPEGERLAVLRRAAQLANEEQLRTFEKAGSKAAFDYK